MSARTRVPIKYTSLTNNSVKTSLIPSSQDWITIGANTNYLLGKGTELLPFAFHLTTSLSLETNYKVHLAVFPTKQALERTWIAGFHPSGATSFHVQFGVNSGAMRTYPLVGRYPTLTKVETISDPYAQQLTGTVCFLSFAASGEGTFYMDSLGCWENPRTQLDENNRTEGGIDIDSFAPNSAIYEDPKKKDSVYAASVSISGARHRAKRSGLYGWAVPSHADGSVVTTFAKTTTSATFVSASTLPIPVLPRKDIESQTRKVQVAIYAWASDTTTAGEIQLVGQEQTLTVTVGPFLTASKPAVFFGTHAGVLVEAPNGDRGINENGYDRLIWKHRRSAGAGNFYYTCLIVGEID